MNNGHNVAIKVEGLAKKYRINQGRSHDTLRDSIMGRVSGMFSRSAIERNVEDPREFWALRDVSFEVAPGEIVGVIGRNGAGKSTLLKTLARITEPSKGRIDVFGRVGSLLEVGTGFHQELSGRENVYLSGSILGMKKAEIDRHFDEIVDFAEVEKFIDTPVKHYSSGMYLRLAFGVAAFLQPEILLIDEVLAVGDAVFQKKCLGKMEDVAKQGRTVLFVSHNMGAVQELCSRCILIENGYIGFDGSVNGATAKYFSPEPLARGRDASLTREMFSVSDLRIGNQSQPVVTCGEPFEVEVTVRGRRVKNPFIFLIIENVFGQQVVHSRIDGRDIGLGEIEGEHVIHIDVPALWLTPGSYSAYFKFLTSSTGAKGKSFSERILVDFRGDFDGSGKSLLNPKLIWKSSGAIVTNNAGERIDAALSSAT